MQRFKQPNMDLHPDGEWIRYHDHVEAMKRIAGDGAQQPIYQVWDVDMLAWKDVQQDSYNERLPSNRRIVYAAPAPTASPDDQVEDALACQTCNGQGEVNHSDEGGFTRDECPTCHGSCLRKDALPEQPPIDNRYVADGCEQFASPADRARIEAEEDDKRCAEGEREMGLCASPAALTDETRAEIDDLLRACQRWHAGDSHAKGRVERARALLAASPADQRDAELWRTHVRMIERRHLPDTVRALVNAVEREAMTTANIEAMSATPPAAE